MNNQYILFVSVGFLVWSYPATPPASLTHCTIVVRVMEIFLDLRKGLGKEMASLHPSLYIFWILIRTPRWWIWNFSVEKHFRTMEHITWEFLLKSNLYRDGWRPLVKSRHWRLLKTMTVQNYPWRQLLSAVQQGNTNSRELEMSLWSNMVPCYSSVRL